MGVNVVGTFLAIQAVAAGMLQRGFGRIVIVSSNSAFGASGSSIPFAVSKGAGITLGQCLARTLAPHVQVNAVAPGWMLAEELRGNADAAISADGVAVTGQAMVIDGGETTVRC